MTLKAATRFFILFLLFISLVGAGCSTKTTSPSSGSYQSSKKYSKATQRPYVINGVRYYPIPTAEGYRERGKASWYGKKFHGRKTANGETYNMYGKTAAHKTLPIGTMLLVKNLENGRSIVVRVNDRGPFVKKRIIDLTYTGAKSLDMIQNGTASVEITALSTKKIPMQTQVAQQKPATGQPDPVNRFEQGIFYVQLGAFGKVENARNLAKKYADKGRDVVIQQYPAADMSLYRVMVYSGTSLAKAKTDERHFEQTGFPDAFLLAR